MHALYAITDEIDSEMVIGPLQYPQQVHDV